jgi:hypothetical protein
MSHLPVSHRLSEESSAASSDTYIPLKPLLLEKDDDEPYQKTQGCRWSRWCTVAAWIAQLLLFVASVAFFCLGAGKRHLSDQQCAEQLSAYCESPVSSALRPVLPMPIPPQHQLLESSNMRLSGSRVLCSTKIRGKVGRAPSWTRHGTPSSTVSRSRARSGMKRC